MGVIVLWVSSTPVFSRLIYAQLENRFPPIAIDSLQHVDVAILLGGSVKPSRAPQLAPEFNAAFDRVWHAAMLFKAGKIDYILISGGQLPWKNSGQPEADLTAVLLTKLGVPEKALIAENQSRNTYENAVFSRPFWKKNGFSTGYLVTSAAHMPRALAVFQKAGFALKPAATDYRVIDPAAKNIFDCLPNHEALALTTLAMKEVLGLVIYKWRGWA